MGSEGVASTYSINLATDVEDTGNLSESVDPEAALGTSSKKMAELVRGSPALSSRGRAYGSLDEPKRGGYGEDSGGGYGYQQLPPARAAGSGAQPNLAFVDVSYVIPSSFYSKKKDKVILDSVRYEQWD